MVRSASVIVIYCFLLFSSVVSAFNITKILERYPEYSMFNQLLSEHNLASEVNRRQTITILAVNNGAMSAITSQPPESIKNIMMNHVVLDYYDVGKLRNLKKGSNLLTTLFQTTGVASHQQGFLNVSSVNGEIMFGSAYRGAPLNSKLEKAVASQPYNISVLEISTPIIAPGITGAPVAPIAPVAAPPPKAPTRKGLSPADAPSDDEPVADAPAPSEAEAPAPAADAPAPVADGPAPSPSEEAAADEDKTASSSSSRNAIVSGALLMASLLAAL